MKLSKIEYKNSLPSFKTLGSANLLIYDNYFENDLPGLLPIQAWMQSFPYRIGFPGGEKLKDLSSFPEKMAQILELVSKMAVKDVQIVSFGGGSIGDFSGFVASILKRGLPLVHIPTTWLAAMDSSHGGKTALNVSGYKNQIGTFYPANKIILVKLVLFLQPKARTDEAFGEALKISLLTGKNLWKNFLTIKIFDHNTAWKFLPKLIDGKYTIVKKDPFEKKGVRHLLNLGHTFGHVWEASLNLPHGMAVSFGIRAALELGKHQGVISESNYDKISKAPAIKLLPTRADLIQLIQRTDPKKVESYLIQDKKISKKHTLRFIFIRQPGQCIIADIKIKKLTEFYLSLHTEPVL